MSGTAPDRGQAPKRSLGQNFLVDPNTQRKIVEELHAEPDDVVLEIGPGHGELSQHLLGRVRRLVLIEKDHDLAGGLRDHWGEREDVQIVDADALKVDLAELCGGGVPFRIISNVPYNITSPLVFTFLAIRPSPTRILLTVQREVAERIVAAPGSKIYGALSVGVQAVADATLTFRVGRQAFRPVPDVDSAVVRIDPRPEALGGVEAPALRDLTRACFNRRRKQLQKILRTSPELGFDGDPAAFLANLDIDPSVRPETLAPATFVALALALQQWREAAPSR